MKKKSPAIQKKSTAANEKKSRSKPFPIVAIGASAGGLEAITALLKQLPSNTGMAYVYIQHLDPTHESILTSLLSKATKMKVTEAKNLSPIERNHLYVIPPNKDMTVIDGVLKLQPRPARPIIHLPIDAFFLSLAEKQKAGAIGIVLSGNASDGALGLKAIKSAGGLTFAQDASAKFQSMPKAAIAEGSVDLVLSPEEIANELARLSKRVNVIQSVMGEIEEDIPVEEDLTNILQLLRKSSDVDFTHYKKSTIRRRIVRRMLLHQLETLKDYAQYLRQHAGEVNSLYQDLLINVTNFFRDTTAFDYLKKKILPRIVKRKSPQDLIRIWVPGCSTGQEAYSIAILLFEVLKEKTPNTAIQIFATDLSELAINKARIGIYSKAELTDVSPKRLQNFFTKVDGSFRINKVIRDLCVFAQHNVLNDPPFSRIDLISCCNLLIYLDIPLQKKLMSTFHYALNKTGYLMLGKSESIGEAQRLFSQPDRKYKIYSKKGDQQSKPVFETNYSFGESLKSTALNFKKILQKKEITHTQALEQVVNEILLTHYVPVSVIVNNDLEILQFRGSTGFFLEPGSGKASLNLLKMARPGLAFELRNAVQKAQKSGEPVNKKGIEIQDKGDRHLVTFEVYPFRTDADDLLYLITFHEEMLPKTEPESAAVKKDKKVKHLEKELSTMREDLRSLVEDQEASNEELQSANEEIVSSNEELQSINEELETSKEEIESANEELMTVNQELQIRNEQLAESYEYASSMLDTINEAVIMLDQYLRVKSCNQSFYKLFHTNADDAEGKMLYELGNHQWEIPKLRILLEEIIPRNSRIHGFRVEAKFPGIGEKVMLVNAQKIDRDTRDERLILLSIEDITEYEQSQKIIAERENWFRNIADGAPVMMWFADTTRARIFFNQTWLDYTGKKMEDELGLGWTEEVHPDDIAGLMKIYRKAFEEEQSYQAEYRLRRHDGGYRWMLSSGKPSFDINGTFSGFIGTVTDIHDQKIAVEVIKESEERVQTVLRGLPLMAWMTDADGKRIFYNKKIADYFGFTKENIPKEMSSEFYHPDDYQRFVKSWKEHLQSGAPLEIQVRFKRSDDGAYRWHLLRAQPIRDETGNITSWVGTNTDIHDQKMFTEELERRVLQRTKDLQEANNSLARSNNELEQFAYVASHDLQEPLRKIVTFIDRLNKLDGKTDSEKESEYLRKITSSAKRMSVLINDLLNFSRLGKEKEMIRMVDLNQTLSSVLPDFENIITDKKGEIKVEELPVIEAVPVQMKQLFHNLISNALKFSNEKPPKIIISSRTYKENGVPLKGDAEKKYIHITVTDNGIGFKQQYADQIFQIFQRLHDQKNYPGTGIGLAICKRIAENHKGTIYAEAKENDGAVFHIILPERQE